VQTTIIFKTGLDIVLDGRRISKTVSQSSVEIRRRRDKKGQDTGKQRKRGSVRFMTAVIVTPSSLLSHRNGVQVQRK